MKKTRPTRTQTSPNPGQHTTYKEKTIIFFFFFSYFPTNLDSSTWILLSFCVFFFFSARNSPIFAYVVPRLARAPHNTYRLPTGVFSLRGRGAVRLPVYPDGRDVRKHWRSRTNVLNWSGAGGKGGGGGGVYVIRVHIRNQRKQRVKTLSGHLAMRKPRARLPSAVARRSTALRLTNPTDREKHRRRRRRRFTPGPLIVLQKTSARITRVIYNVT